MHTIVGVKMQSYLMKVANSSIELRTFFILPSQSRSGVSVAEVKERDATQALLTQTEELVDELGVEATDRRAIDLQLSCLCQRQTEGDEALVSSMLELLFLRHLTERLLQHIGVALEATTYQTTLIGRQVVDLIDTLGRVLIPSSEDDDGVSDSRMQSGVQSPFDHLLLELLVADDDQTELLQAR